MQQGHQPFPTGGLAYLLRITGSCLTLLPTSFRSSANTISGVRSKKPISRRQLVPHLQWNRPMNCCFILRPQFGQTRLLAPIIVYWSLAIISSADIPLASSFFNTDSASAFLDSSAAFFFGSSLFCLCFRKFLCCNLQSRFFTFQLFLQCANVVRQCGNLGFNLFLGCGLFSNNSRILVMLQASPSAQAQRET